VVEVILQHLLRLTEENHEIITGLKSRTMVELKDASEVFLAAYFAWFTPAL
jgi:hypothetical protein